MKTKYKILEKNDSQNSTSILLVEIDKNFVSSFRQSTINDLKQEIEVDGFRKGKVPESKVIEVSGELKIWEKNAFKAINSLIPSILQDENLNIITMPNVSLIKLAPGVNLEIKMELTLMPEVKLPDYKNIAQSVKKEKETEATEKEIDEYINHIRENKKQIDKLETAPELNDDFVKSLGNFKDVEDFKKQITENISRDKKLNLDQKRRVEIIEKIIKESEIQLPEILIQEEQEKMLAEFKARVEGFKMDFNEYLKEIKKTEEELKKEWLADSEKRAKMNLILPKIAREENLKPDEKQLEDEVKHLKEHYKDINDNTAKLYVANILTNQKVFEFLESL